ncbi:hypothetical protein V5P93_005443 [Actinokineospora auranticolor]|uniref:Septum formation initiator n=1 Tax=Actinokineospora auranticolor TaxID=155976 RepID=A0A2S6GQQ7_9PSEU|nr:hypothetical protein [Actinokineospora auranticolor]PPK67529.1 hypothetical protein CLV40_107194 [Actinokineospora auranticolor]
MTTVPGTDSAHLPQQSRRPGDEQPAPRVPRRRRATERVQPGGFWRLGRRAPSPTEPEDPRSRRDESGTDPEDGGVEQVVPAPSEVDATHRSGGDDEPGLEWDGEPPEGDSGEVERDRPGAGTRGPSGWRAGVSGGLGLGTRGSAGSTAGRGGATRTGARKKTEGTAPRRSAARGRSGVEVLDAPPAVERRPGVVERARRPQRDGAARSHSTARAAATQENTSGRASFVVLIISLLVVGVAATLWLTTQAVADSYRLEGAKQAATLLAEQVERLQQDVAKQESAPALADRARALGMVPAGDAAWLVVTPDGRIKVVGTPKPAAPAPATPDPTQPDPGQQPPAGEQPPAGTPPAPEGNPQPGTGGG